MCAQQRERGRAPHRLLVLDELDLHAFARDAAAHPEVRVRVRIRIRVRVRVRVTGLGLGLGLG